MKDEDGLKEEICGLFIPAIITELIKREEIGVDADEEKIKSAIQYFLKNENIEHFKVALVIGDEFEKAIEQEIGMKRNMVAFVLAGMCIEHILNEFYQELLINKYNLSNTEFSSCMKGLSIKDKLTWLYKLTVNECFDNELFVKVCIVCRERNSIVHYKPKIETISDWDSKVNEENEDKINVKELLPLISNMKYIFSNKLSEIFEEKNAAERIYMKYFKDK